MPPPPPRRLVSRRLPGRPPDHLERRLRRGSSPSTRLRCPSTSRAGGRRGRALRPPPQRPPDHPRACDDSFTSRGRLSGTINVRWLYSRAAYDPPGYLRSVRLVLSVAAAVVPPSASVTSPGIVGAAATPPRRQRVRGHQERFTARRRRHPHTHPRGCHDSFTVAVRWPSRTGSRAASGPPPTVKGTMTTPPLLALAAAKDVLTGCLREILRTIHSVATAHPHRVFGDHQGSSAVCLRDIPRPSTRPRRYLTANIRRRQELFTARLRDIFRVIRAAAAACPPRALLASMTTYLPAAFTSGSGPSTLVYPPRLPSITDLILAPCSPLASGTSSGPVARLRRPVHMAPPLPMTTCVKAAFRTAFGPYPPRLPSVTATSSVRSAQQPPRALGN
jgi:hypothetical protein